MLLEIDPALIVGRLLGVQGDDAFVQAQEAKAMAEHNADKAARTKARRAASAAGKQIRSELKAVIERQTATDRPSASNAQGDRIATRIVVVRQMVEAGRQHISSG